jgi:hypothetical protein
VIYVKMAYHLAQEARAGLNEFRIPPEFGRRQAANRRRHAGSVSLNLA